MSNPQRNVTFDEDAWRREFEERIRAAEQRAQAEAHARQIAEQWAHVAGRAYQAEAAARQAVGLAYQAEAAARQAENVLVRDCIRGAPVTSRRVHPAWGEPLLEGESTTGTKTPQAWLPVDGTKVEHWKDSEFIEYLRAADRIFVRHGEQDVSLLQLILAGRTDVSTANVLRGTALGTSTRRCRSEIEVEDVLRETVWAVLERIMGKAAEHMPDERDRYPAGDHITTTVYTSGDRTSLVPMHFYPVYQQDRTIETRWNQLAQSGRVFPSVLENDEDARAGMEARCSRVVVEIKPDCITPKKRLEGGSDPADVRAAKNAAYAGHLINYMKSSFFHPLYNPVAQVVTYAVASRTSPVAVCTINRMTFGFVGDDPPLEAAANPASGATVPMTKLSRTFDWSSPDPPLRGGRGDANDPFRPNDVVGPDWSHFEVLVRFILASKGRWYRRRVPDALKALFAHQMQLREAAKRKQEGSAASSSASSTAKSASGSKAEAAHPSGESDEAQDASSGAEPLLCLNESMTSSQPAGEDAQFPMPRPYWPDLWAPLRFAIPATHPELECSPEHLEGDADQIAQGRIGPVYRKTLYGFDAVFKVLPFLKYKHSRERNLPTRDELKDEAEAYRRLAHLQGVVVPRLLWYGEIAEGALDALVTEYAGVSYEKLCDTAPLSQEQVASAIAALQQLHEAGVQHGDAELRNVVWRPARGAGEPGRALLVDLGRAWFREDARDVDYWTSSTREEAERFSETLGEQSAVSVGEEEHAPRADTAP